MAAQTWQIAGDYFETCSCDYLCPCITTNLGGKPTKGYCDVAMVFHIDHGHFNGTALDDLSFVLVAHSPDVMGMGNWSVGLITDDRATAEQQEGLTAIASGQAGGPAAGLAPLLGKFLGVESKPIHFAKNGTSRSVSIPGLLEQGVEGVLGGDQSTPVQLENTMHPANSRLALAHATESHLHAFGMDWDDTSGSNNGHFAPFNWQVG